MGLLPPVGFWDLLEFAKNGGKENVLRCRAVKTKRGRFSLCACIGYFAREYSKRGCCLSPSTGIEYSEVPNGLVVFSKVPLAGPDRGLLLPRREHRLRLPQRKNIGKRKDASMTSEKREPGSFAPGRIGAFTRGPDRLRVGGFGALHGLASEGLSRTRWACLRHLPCGPLEIAKKISKESIGWMTAMMNAVLITVALP